MQTFSPFNWNTFNTPTPFGWSPWNNPSWTPSMWNTFPGFQNYPVNTTPWSGFNTTNSWSPTWNRPVATTPWSMFQPWNTFNSFENFNPWSNWAPTWNSPFNTSWFQPTANWFNSVPFGFHPGVNQTQPFVGSNAPASYPFAGHTGSGGGYPFSQAGTPVYPTGQFCRDAA